MTSAYSCESNRTKAYSMDLRWRIIHQKCSLGLSCKEVGERLCVDPATVSRTVRLFEETGTVCSIQGYPMERSQKLSSCDKVTIFEAVMKEPCLYLHEIQEILLTTTGSQISILSTICKFLKKQRLTRKKLSFRALQRDVELRRKFFMDVLVFETDMLYLWMKQGLINVPLSESMAMH